MKIRLLLMTLAVIAATSAATAHNGRRFEIQIMDDQLFAQGYLSGTNPNDDGGGILRPYVNALHDHWSNVGGVVATATLPGFDLKSTDGLFGYDLNLTLTGSGKWSDPMNNVSGGGHMGHGGMPILSSLDASETIFVGFGNQASIDTDALINPNTPDSFLIAETINGPVTDIDLEYSILQTPNNVLYYLQWELSTTAPGISASAPIYTIFSPDKDDPVNSPGGPLHHQALALESYLGTPASAPEPNAATLLVLSALGWCSRRKR